MQMTGLQSTRADVLRDLKALKEDEALSTQVGHVSLWDTLLLYIYNPYRWHHWDAHHEVETPEVTFLEGCRAASLLREVAVHQSAR